MKVDRRSFLKLAGMTGVSVSLPLGERSAFGAEPYDGPFYVMVNAGGGWDPTFLCNPKAGTDFDRISEGDGNVGSLRYAAIPISAPALGLTPEQEPFILSNQRFFEKHGSRILVLNGVDTSTNNHDGGSRATWSGRLSVGYPAFGALVGAARGGDVPMPFVSGGGYDATQNLIPLTRVRNATGLINAARPNLIDPNNPDSRSYHSAATMRRIRAVQTERLAASAAKVKLPQTRRAMASLQLARSNDDVLERLELPAQLVELPGGQVGDLQQMMRQTQLALSAFRSGLAVSASITLGGFDTHANHDQIQVRQLAKLLSGIDFLVEEATRLGLEERLVIMVGSDFGRGPHYNGTNPGSGKDHFTVTSVMLMGPGISGGRVIGTTDERHLPSSLDPQTLQPAETGIRLAPGHIHQSLRSLAGIADSPLARQFPLPESTLPLFEA